jgi:hypothetical protein
MGNDSEKAMLFCPDCGADVPPTGVRCWRCHCPFPNGPKAAGATSFAKKQAEKKDQEKFQFTQASLLLIATLAVIVAGIYLLAPGLGIFATIISLPALVRTIMISRERGTIEHPLSFGEKLGHFLGWLGLGAAAVAAGATVMGFAGVIMFLIACFSGKLDAVDWIKTPQQIGMGTAIMLMLFFWVKIKF